MAYGALVDVGDLGHLQRIEQVVQMLRLGVLLMVVLRCGALKMLGDMRLVCHIRLLLLWMMVGMVGVVNPVVGWRVRHERP